MFATWYCIGDIRWPYAAVPASARTCEVVPVAMGRYPDGEVRVDLTVKPHPRAVVAAALTDPETGCFEMSQLWSVLAVASAAKQHGARRVVALVPELPCLRQDRPTARTFELAARHWIGRLLDASDLDAAVTVHPKPGFGASLGRCLLDSPADTDIAAALAEHLRKAGAEVDAVVAPDHGARAFAAAFADTLGCRRVDMAKRRTSTDTVELVDAADEDMRAVGACLIVDDMYVSGATMLAVARRAARGGPVWAFVPNFRPTATGLRRLEELFSLPAFEGLFIPAHAAPDLANARLHRVDTADLVGLVLRRALDAPLADLPEP